MIAAPIGVRVMVSAKPVDFRKGMDGLTALVESALSTNPFTGDLFVFRSRRADRIKIIFWDGSGLCLYHKRLEGGGFVWPSIKDGAVRLTTAQFAMLLEGLDWSQIKPIKIIVPIRAG